LIQKEKDRICEANPMTGAGNNPSLLLNQKHTIPLFTLEPALPMSVGPTQRVKNM